MNVCLHTLVLKSLLNELLTMFSCRAMLLWSVWSALLLLPTVGAAEDEEDVRAGMNNTVIVCLRKTIKLCLNERKWSGRIIT